MFGKGAFSRSSGSASPVPSTFGRVVPTPFDTPGRSSGGHPAAGARVARVMSAPTNELALSNRLIVSPQDFRSDQYVMVDDMFVFTTK